MKLHELQKQIVSGKLDKLYMMYGQEVGIMDIYLDKMTSIMGVDIVRCDTVREAFSKMVQRRINNSPKCFIVRNDEEFLKEEKIWPTVFNQVFSGDNYLVLVFSAMDKRCKFYKRNKDNMIEFEKLSPEMLSRYIKKELPELSENNCLLLSEICENDYNRILLECHKIRHYMNASGKNVNDCFRSLIEQGVIFQPIGDITFKFTDAILTRNFRDTSKFLDMARRKQEPEILVLSVLYNGFKQILMVQGLGEDQRDPVKRTGLTPWQVKMAKEKQGHYSLSEIIHALRTIRFAEKGIKTGQIDADISLEYVISNIM